MKTMREGALLSALLLIAAAAPAQQAATVEIDAQRAIAQVSPTLYGLMTEEINHSYDGGLYAEMIQNRAFHSTWEGEPPWDLVRHGNSAATRSLDKSTGPSDVLNFSMKLSVTEASKGNA